MATDSIILNFQAEISALAVERLGRPLSAKEQAFITRHEGLIALESIFDYVATLSGPQLEQYLSAD